MFFRVDRWVIKSTNRNLWIGIEDQPGKKDSIFTVDEMGAIGSLDAIECALALDAFRAYTILDDLAEAGDENTA
jgi:hypothetical protein